jgi:hypothetical protein
MRATHTITDIDSLQRALWLRCGTRITFVLPSLSPEISKVQQENLERRFNLQLSDSGSGFCILAFIAALVGCILFDAAQWPFFAVHPVTMLASNVAVCLVAAGLGKTLGYLYARWQLARLIWAVAERLETMEENASPLPFPSAPRGDLFVPSTHSLSRATIR